ncbi:spermidine synthase [Micromonospora fluostatini]|uniref:Spermidine synthase n=1 Tax=Micromonospora fluostatini TaxID=1629071 RepID=A0ABY2DI55_9ACTN|nr:spermidine synthase [Micromonospora fluostatini]
MSSSTPDVTASPDEVGPPPVRALPPGLAAFLVFFSSGAVLVLETVALRLVGPYVGVTLQVTSAVIGVALAAIAYGTWAGGWLADRRDPRPLLAPALLISAIATAVTLPIVRYAGEVLRGGAVSAVMLLTVLAVFVPAMLLSAVTPLVVKLQLADLRQTGQVVGKLSGIGTLGGITATFATGFVLVAALTSTTIVLATAVALAVAGVGLWVYLRRQDGVGRLPGPARTRATLAVLGLVGAGLTTVAPNPCDIETAYHCASVETDPDRASGRTLLLNSAQHSYVDLADPTHLEYAYTQWFGAVADVSAPTGARLDALHLGGGGFTVPRYLTATRPGTDNLVFEIDGGLVDLSREQLGLRTGPQLRAEVGDARILLGEEPSASRDLVVGDAFGHLVVPWHLATREMAAEIRRVLRPGGIYVQNVIDYAPLRFVRSELATVHAEFPHVALVAPPAALAGEWGSNFVIVASVEPLPLAALRARLDQLPERVSLLAGAELAEFVDDALVLTDDYAPVDQLLGAA